MDTKKKVLVPKVSVLERVDCTNKGMIKENRGLKINLEGTKHTSSGRNPTARGFFNLL